MKTTLLAAATILLWGATARAQWGEEKPGTVAVGFGLTSPTSDDLDSFANRSVSFSGYATRPFAGPLGWRAELGYDGFSLDDEVKALCDGVGSCTDPRVLRLAGGVQFGGYGGGTTLPYALFTLGMFNVDTGDPGQDSETDLGVSLGTGVNWHVAETWGIGVDFHYNGFWPKEEAGESFDTQWYTVTTFQLFFRW